MTAPPPYGRSPRVPGPREVVQTYFLVGNNNLHPHLLNILLLPNRTGNGATHHLVRFPNPLLEWVGGTKPSRGVFFSSEAPGTFNMDHNPILAYIFELRRMSAPTFAVPNPLQVNSVES